MSGSRGTRTQRCSAAQARTRLGQARRFEEVAELVVGEGDVEYSSVAAALAVLAGIAACDAACCQVLGRRARGQDHHAAEDLLTQIEPGGKAAANALRRLLNLKDDAHYGLADISGQALETTLRQAKTLVAFADRMVHQ